MARVVVAIVRRCQDSSIEGRSGAYRYSALNFSTGSDCRAMARCLDSDHDVSSWKGSDDQNSSLGWHAQLEQKRSALEGHCPGPLIWFADTQVRLDIAFHYRRILTMGPGNYGIWVTSFDCYHRL